MKSGEASDRSILIAVAIGVVLGVIGYRWVDPERRRMTPAEVAAFNCEMTNALTKMRVLERQIQIDAFGRPLTDAEAQAWLVDPLWEPDGRR